MAAAPDDFDMGEAPEMLDGHDLPRAGTPTAAPTAAADGGAPPDTLLAKKRQSGIAGFLTGTKMTARSNARVGPAWSLAGAAGLSSQDRTKV